MAAGHYLRITDGTTTVTFADGADPPGATNYEVDLNGWSPQIARLRGGALGGRGPYEDVVEELTINVKGTSAANAMANLGTLAGLLDQAERWSRSWNVSPVKIQYSPKGATISSTADPLTALILGRAPGDQTGMLSLPVNFDPSKSSYIISARIRFTRRGLWTRNAINFASFAAGTAHSVANFTFNLGLGGPTLYPSPAKLYFNSGSNTSASTIRGFLLVESNEGTEELQQQEAESLADGASFVNTSESTFNALGSAILRYTPAHANAASTQTFSLNSVLKGRSPIAIFATMRSNASRPDWTVYLQITQGDVTLRTSDKVVPHSDGLPRAVNLGLISVPRGNATPTAKLYVKSGGGASGSFDIDTIWLFPMDKPYNYAIGLDTISTLGAATASRLLHFDSGPTCLMTPNVGFGGTGGTFQYHTTYDGDAYLMSGCDAVDVYLFATTGSYWRISKGGGAGSPFLYSGSMLLYPAHTIPE